MRMIALQWFQQASISSAPANPQALRPPTGVHYKQSLWSSYRIDTLEP